jgi:hypothetical protein
MARPWQRHDLSRTGSRSGFAGRAGTGGGPGFPVPSGDRKRTTRILALVQAWAAGIVVLVVTEYLQVTLLYENAAGRQGPQSFGAALALVHLPNLVCVALATWAAARCHPEPDCERPVPHAIAACTVPVAAQVFAVSVERDLPGYDAFGLWVSSAVLVTGCVVGWSVERWRRRAEPSGDTSGGL